MHVTPEAQHGWLKKFIGDWNYEGEAPAGPDHPACKCTGIETVQPLGDVWVLGEGRGEMPGGGMGYSRLQLGYDPQRQRFVGTWIGSMMTHLWVYEGTLDDAERVLTLETEGPNFAEPGKMARYRDVHEFKSDSHRILTSWSQDESGAWHQFMQVDYHRR